MLPDVQHAFRGLCRTPWFTVLAIGMLAVGIGTTTALFSLVNAVVLRDFPYLNSDRLVELHAETATRGGGRVPALVLDALRARSTTLEQIAIHGPVAGVLQASDGPVDVRGDRVSANFLDVVGARPLTGRGFVADDEQAGAADVLIVSYVLASTYLDGADAAVGRVVALEGTAYTVIGVMGPDFRTAFDAIGKDYWTPTVPAGVRARELEAGYELIATLRPHRSIAAARVELRTIAASVDLADWRDGTHRLGVRSLAEEIVKDSAVPLTMLLGAVALVLLVTCANLAQLTLVRTDARALEFATRGAIGASRTQLFRLAFLENAIIALVGGAAGVVVASALLPVLIRLAPAEIPRLEDASIDPTVLASVLLLSALAALLVGLAPAATLSETRNLHCLMQRPLAGRKSTWFHATLVLIQVAASVSFLSLAGAALQAYLDVRPDRPGFAVAHRGMLDVYIPNRLFPAADVGRARAAELVRDLQSMPGISAAAIGTNLPFTDEESLRPVAVTSENYIDGYGDSIAADVRVVSPNWFALLEIPLRHGRMFTADDRRGTRPVAMVNETFARRAGVEHPAAIVGRHVRLSGDDEPIDYEIVGVSADTRYSGARAGAIPEVHIPFEQRAANVFYLVVDSGLDAATLTRLVRERIRAVLPELPLRREQAITSLEELVSRSVAVPRFASTLLAISAIAALSLAVVGAFGLVAYGVSRRRRELGVRMALGATERDVVTAVLRPLAMPTIAGLAIGAVMSTTADRVLRAQLPSLALSTETLVLSATLATLAAVAVAGYWPAKRASSIADLRL